MKTPNMIDAKRRNKDKVNYIEYDIDLKFGDGKTFFVRTYGCQMNEHDSEKIRGMLKECGFTEAESYENNERAAIAMESFKYAVASYIAKYAAAMSGIDYVVFTGGVGENMSLMRKEVCENMEYMGIELDDALNESTRSKEAVISKPTSKVKVVVIPTDEELTIAQDANKILEQLTTID